MTERSRQRSAVSFAKDSLGGEIRYGHRSEALYELPRAVWEEEIDAALNYAKPLPTEGAEALQDSTEYKVFSKSGG